MGKRGSASHSCHKRTKWAQAQGTSEALDRRLRLAEPDFHPAAPKPCLGQIGIEHKRAIAQGGTCLEIVNKASAHPLGASAAASSLPNSTARWASLVTSAMTFAVFENQPLILAQT